MVDEVCEVQLYLRGEGIVKSNLYRVFWLMSRWYKEHGLSRSEIRDKLTAWADESGIKINYNLNDIIDKVFDKEIDCKLKSPVVKINKQDIAMINKKFDNTKTKLVALAMLCYAKGHANKSGVFSMSCTNLSAWLGINRKSLGNKYIKELLNYDYLLVESAAPCKGKWGNLSYADQSAKYRINAPIHNSGDFVLRGNQIRILFSEAFKLPK